MTALEEHAKRIWDRLRSITQSSDPHAADLVISEAERLETNPTLDRSWWARLKLAISLAKARIEGRRPLRR